MTALFHIVSRSDWSAAVARGEYRPESLPTEGFIHCSFAGQVAGVANARYRKVENLCVIEFETARLDARVVVEDCYGSGTAYPHFYGPIPIAAAAAVHDLTRSANGDYLFIVPGAAGCASSDR